MSFRNLCEDSCNGGNTIGGSGMFTDYVPVTVTYTITPADYEVAGRVIQNNSDRCNTRNNQDEEIEDCCKCCCPKCCCKECCCPRCC